jgi:ferrous iron transport protein B
MSIKIALAGNPNSGKTTLFNALTGSNQYVGNWPGVTVEKKEGRLKKHDDVIIMDLPGIYSLSPYTLEEVVARNYLIDERPDAILNIVDGTNLERNLYLTTQLTELGIPMIVAINMIDAVQKSGDKLYIDRISQELGCPVVEISALKGTGITEAAEKAVDLAKSAVPMTPQHAFSGSVEHTIAHIEEAMQGKIEEIRQRWFAIKIFERDTKVMEQLNLDDAIKAHIEQDIQNCEKEMDDDAESIITNERYLYIASIIRDCCQKKNKGKLSTSDKIDKIVTNRILGLPIFTLVMFCVYYISVTSLGTIVTDWTNDTLFGGWIQPAVGAWLAYMGTAEWLKSLIVDGIIGGLAAPIGFAPQMAILFFFLSILEDCGYMVRIAFIMDRIFHRFGLSGKSFIPLLISSGCGIPGIMASKTIENENDRHMTIVTTTFVPCGAKLPVIALIAGAIMGGAWWMAPTMYFIGVVAVLVSGVMLKKTKWFAGDPAPFVMELPQYHVPSARNVLLHVWERVWSFLKKAGTVLFVCCVVMWFLATYGFSKGHFGMVDEQYSLLAIIGGAIAPIFAPLGFGNWRAVASSLSGFVAKEGIVSTMGVLLGMSNASESDAGLWHAVMNMFPSAVAAFSFLIFNLLDSPCLAAISTIAKEMNSRKWTTFALIYQNVFAYGVTLMVFQFGSYFTRGQFGAGTAVALIILAFMLYMLFRPAPRQKDISDLGTSNDFGTPAGKLG